MMVSTCTMFILEISNLCRLCEVTAHPKASLLLTTMAPFPAGEVAASMHTSARRRRAYDVDAIRPREAFV